MFQSATLWIAVGYLLGSVPFGLLLARARGIDLRAIGSGSIGATNVLRTGNKGLAAATLSFDAGKGFLAVWLAARFGDVAWLPVAAGAAALVGHCYPVWLGFRGGKGVATLLGVTLGVLPFAVVVFGVIWVGIALATRYSSLGGMVASAAIALTAAVSAQGNLWPWFAAMVLVLLWKHRENIARLRAGTESKIGAKA